MSAAPGGASTDDLLAIVERAREHDLSRKVAAGQAAGAPPQAVRPAVRLRAWPDGARAAPNEFLRSALFSAAAASEEDFFNGREIAAISGVAIKQTGPRLDQTDLGVWLAVLQAARGAPIGEPVNVSNRNLLKLLGQGDGGGNRQTLVKKIERLAATTISLRGDRGRFYVGSLIQCAKRNDDGGWEISLNADLAKIFTGAGETWLDEGVRQALAGNQLAQWLHGFFNSHSHPYPIKLETLKLLSGSKNKSQGGWNRKARLALSAVSRASAAVGKTFVFRIDQGKVEVKHAESRGEK